MATIEELFNKANSDYLVELVYCWALTKSYIRRTGSEFLRIRAQITDRIRQTSRRMDGEEISSCLLKCADRLRASKIKKIREILTKAASICGLNDLTDPCSMQWFLEI